MDEMQAKIETWLQLIKLEKLQDVLQDMRTNFRVEPSEKLNDGIFRLLLRLCFMADKCNKQNSKVGQDIAELANFLCSLLIKVPNDNNFVKALFKIVQCLIAFNLYEDAENICCYLQPGILYNPQDDTINLLIKVLSLWRYSIYSMWLELKNESLNAENYNQLKSIMKYEMNMTQMVYKDYTKHLLEGINKHLDRIFMIDKDKKYFDDFCKYILEYLSGVQLYLDKDEKYKIYYHILRIICRVICETTNINNIKSSRKMLDTLFAYFEILTEDKECHQCFQQFQNFCMTLLVPMESLNNSAKDIQNVIYCNVNIAEKYGTKNLKCNAISIAEISEVVLEYWEKCIEIDNSMFKHLVNTGILLEIMNLFIHINTDEFYKEKKSTECKWCSNKLCIVKKDLHNFIATKCRCINLIFKFSLKTLPAKMCTLARKIMKQTVESIIFEIKECECKRWWQSWRTCRNIIYNIGILSEHIYEESVQLYSFLSTCIFQLKDFELNLKSDLENLKIKDFENIITFVLHRLSVVHCNNNMYKKAATACVLNALLTYNHSNTKAFHTWISIKKSAPEEITKMTMLECLKNDKEKIKSELGFSVDTLKYDPIALCLCEARNLLEEQIAFTNGIATLLKTLKKLQPSNQYAHTVLLLGYYFLGFKYDSSILKYYEQAIHDLKKNKSNSVAILCLEANLSLFMFAEELHVMRKQTHLEMENTKFAIYAPKLKEPMETNSSNVVAAYTMINIKKDTNLMLCLQKSLKKWKQLFECYFKEVVKDWEPKLILRILITAGEYARLYRYEDCEAETWTLAFKLALEIKDYIIIYITSRCISLRLINYDWIATANKYITKYRDSKDKNVIGTIATFWISLADLYFECGKYDDAKQLFAEARNLSGISLLANKPVYLLSLDVIIRNNHFYDMQHEDYSSYIEECRLTMRSVNYDLLKKCSNQATYLFSYDVLFTTAINLAIRINSLLSFRGICPDLLQLLKSAQSLNAMLRTAELLKSLCYIDLSRLQLDDCEVKLQALEHMLHIESFQLSMESKAIEIPSTYLAVTPTKIADPVRDSLNNDTSPVLGKKVFDLPKFTLHTDCNCYKCSNVSYQYMVFVTTYIRAQLYALQNHPTAALDHFHGAFEIKRKLFEKEKSVLPENWPRDEIGVKQLSWQIRFYIIDYIQLLIDFCYFLKISIRSHEKDATYILNLASNMCHKYNLERHPVYIMVQELKLDNEFQVIQSSDFNSKFMVPQPHDIDVSDETKSPNSPSVCVTPTSQKYRVKKPTSIRRRKSPVPLKIPKINLIWSDDEDDNSLSPPPPTYSNTKIKSYTNVKKKNVKDLTANLASLKIDDSVSQLENLNEDKNNTQGNSIKDIMIKVASLVPDISTSLMNLVDNTDISAMENTDKLIDSVENLKIKSKTRKSVKSTKQLTVADYNKNIDQAIELLKQMTIKDNTNNNIDSSAMMESKTIDKLQNQNISETYEERKFFKSKLLRENIETASTSSTNKPKNSQNKNLKSFLDNDGHSIRTRSSVRRCPKDKPS